jgi:KDO2-lipid IV(A) lauroyltransferase
MHALDDIAYAAFAALARLSRGLPPGAARAMWVGLGRVAGDGLRIRRRTVDRQLAACFPQLSPGERARLARGVYRHLALSLAEILGDDPQARPSAVRVAPDWSPLEAALAGGRGAIVASAHLGNFELGGRVLAARYRLLDVVKPMRNRRFGDWLERERGRHGIGTVTVDGAAPAVLAHLRGGGVVSLLLDQDAGAGGVRLPFLGREASAWPGAARFSLQTGCPVVPMGILREPDGGHVLHIGAVLRPGGRTADEAGIRTYAAEISAAVESYVRLAPEQWFWVHRRWKEVERGARRAGS